MSEVMTLAGVRAVAESLRALYAGTGFAFVVFDGPPRIRVRYADPDKTQWQEIATCHPAPLSSPAQLQSAVVMVVEGVRHRWADEAFRRYQRLLNHGMLYQPKPEPKGAL